MTPKESIKAVLEWYADPERYKTSQEVIWDQGDRARVALALIDKIEDKDGRRPDLRRADECVPVGQKIPSSGRAYL